MDSSGDPVLELDRQVQRGSLFTQAVLQRTSQRVSETEAILARVIDQLAGQGLLDPQALGLEVEEEPQAAPGEDPPELASPTMRWPGVAIREDPVDEAVSAAAVDCDARMHICKAVCCRLKFPLSAREVEEGALRWDIGHPYLIRHESDGYCAHNDRATHGCTVYGERPTVCRTYSCAGDQRIWTDFDGMVLNEAWIEEHLATGDGMYFETVMASMEMPVQLTRKPA